MILTGKALEGFLVRIYYTEDTNKASDESYEQNILSHSTKWLDRQNERFVRTLIIDWFDSIDINIDVYICSDKTFDFRINTVTYNTWCKTRQEAIKQAINKANEIYNNDNNR